MKIALTMTGRHAEAQDVAQEVFLRFFRSLDRFDAARNPLAWFRTVTVRTCLNLLEQRKRVEANEQFGEPDLYPASEQVRSGELDEVLTCLTPRERAAFVLVYQYGYSTNEAGEALGIASGTIKALCFRARGKLRKALHKDEGHEGR